MAMLRSEPRLVAVLGPTNTGKTHLAIERMLDHQSGMIGFPLRLLARENYDRVVKLRGARTVALITGEEKILPPNPSYFVCTVESMPLDRAVEFLAVDEIQLCADTERGHVFTARLLHARGLSETMFLGSDTIRPLMRRLVPEAEYVARPRFSTLSHTGYKKVTRLPPRSAVVAFSMADVFSLAELVRRQRGGTAVLAQHKTALPVRGGVAEEPRRAAARGRTGSSAQRGRPSVAAAAGASRRRHGAGDPSRRRPAAVGGLPDTGFPQDYERQPCA